MKTKMIKQVGKVVAFAITACFLAGCTAPEKQTTFAIAITPPLW